MAQGGETTSISLAGWPDWAIRMNGGDTYTFDGPDDKSLWGPKIKAYKERLKRQREEDLRIVEETKDQRREEFQAELDRGTTFSDYYMEHSEEVGSMGQAFEGKLREFKSKPPTAFTAQDLVYLHKHGDAFKGKGIEIPSWFKEESVKQGKFREQMAKDAVRRVTPHIKDDPFERIRDEPLKDLATQALIRSGETPAVAAMAAEGVDLAAEERQKPMQQALGALGLSKQAIPGRSVEMTKQTVKTAPNDLLPSLMPMPVSVADPEKYMREQLGELRVGGQPLPQEVIDRTIADYNELARDGFIDERTGRAYTRTIGGLIATPMVLAGKVGVKGAPDSYSPIGYKLRGVLQSYPEYAQAAAKDWEATIGKRGQEALEQELGVARTAVLLRNLGLGFKDQVQGMWQLLNAPFADKGRDALVEAYRGYLVDDRGGRPLMDAEVDLIEAEVDSGFGAQLLLGMRENFKRMVTDTEKSLHGDPLGWLTTAVGFSRALLAGKVPVPAKNMERARAVAKGILAKADEWSTGIPLVRGAIKGVDIAAEKIPVVREVVGGLKAGVKEAKKYFTTKARSVLGAQRAAERGQEIEAGLSNIFSSIERKVDDGASEADAVKAALDEAPKEAGDVYAAAYAEAKLGIPRDAEIPNKQDIVTAWLDNDTTRLKELIPDEVLTEAGIKPTMVPRGMRDAKGPEYKTVELDSVVVNKHLDDEFLRLRSPEVGRGAEVDALLRSVPAIKRRLGRGELTHPLLRPEDAGGIPRRFKENGGLNNHALLAALVEQAEGRPIRVTVRADEASWFEGPLVGPKDIIDKIPRVWRTRLPVYRKRAEARAPELLDIMDAGDLSDFALYIKRAEKLGRKEVSEAAFRRLKERVLEATGLTAEEFNKTRLGGLTTNVDDAFELIVRRSERVPGAPVALPALRGVGRTVEPTGPGGRPLPPPDIPADAPMAVPPHLTERQREALRVKERPVGVADAEAARAAEARAMRGEEPVAPTPEPEGVPGRAPEPEEAVPAREVPAGEAEAIRAAEARALRGEPIFDIVEERALVEDVLGRVSRMDNASVRKALSKKQGIVDAVKQRLVRENMRRELDVGDSIANGMEWPDKTLPQVFSGAVDEVAAKLIETQGRRGRRFVSDMGLQEASPLTRKYLGARGDEAITVPSYVNDGFAFLEQNTRMNRSALQKVPSLVKRFFTTRNPLTYFNNFMSNVWLRGATDGRFDMGSLRGAAQDVKSYMSGRRGDLSPEKLQMLDAMNERGAFISTVRQDLTDRGLARMPSEWIHDKLLEAGLDGKANRALDRYNKLLQKHEKAYTMADPMFKVDHVFTQVEKFMDSLKELEAGKHVDLEVDKGLFKRVYRADDGSYRMGSPDGRVLSDQDLRKLSTERAVTSANNLYFDYMDVPNIVDLLRSTGFDSLVLNPFFTWNWKAMYIPLVKRGLGREVITGAFNVSTNSPALRAQMARNMLGAEFKRQLLMQTGMAASRHEALRDPELMKFAMRFNYAAPYRGIVNWGDRESYMFGTSGVDPSAAQDPLNAFLVSSLTDSSKPMARLTMPEDEAEKLLLQKLHSQNKASSLRYIMEQKKDNPDYLKELIREARSTFPMFDYDLLGSMGRTAGMDRPMINMLVNNSMREEVTVSERLSGALIGMLWGSKGADKAFKEAIKATEGEADLIAVAKAVGIRRISNNMFNKSLRRMEAIQKRRLRDQYDLERLSTMPTETQEKREPIRAILNAIVSNDMAAFSRKLAKEGEERGLKVGWRRGFSGPKPEFEGTERQ